MTASKLDQLAENVTLKLAARVSMAIVGGLSLPVLFGAWTWATSTNAAIVDLKTETNKQIAELTTRVTVIENNSQRGRIDRKEADAELKALLQELVRQGASTNERLARLEVRFDAADRERR